MAQLGFHGLVGVGLGRLMAPGPGAAAPRGGPPGPDALGPGTGDPKEDPAGHLRWGLVLGSILPDTDFFLLGPLYFFNAQLALNMHRSFTHSLVTTALVLLYFRLRSHGRDRALWSLGLGISIGMAIHNLLDLVFWFSGSDLFWPLGFFGLPSYVNFWAGWQNPPIVPKLLGAADYLAFGLFFWYVGRRAQTLGTDTAFLPRLRLRMQMSAVLWVVFTGLALTPISGTLFDIIHYALFIVVFLPLMLQTVWRMRATLSAP